MNAADTRSKNQLQVEIKNLQARVLELEVKNQNLVTDPGKASDQVANLLLELTLALRNLLDPNPYRIQIIMNYDRPRGIYATQQSPQSKPSPDDTPKLFTAIRVHARTALSKGEHFLSVHAGTQEDQYRIRATLESGDQI